MPHFLGYVSIGSVNGLVTWGTWNQCWTWSLIQYGVLGLQWVKPLCKLEKHKVVNLNGLYGRLPHSPSVLAMGRSVGYDLGLVGVIICVRLASQNIIGGVYGSSAIWASNNALWAYVAGGNSHHFSEDTDSPLHSPHGRQICLPLGLCKETVKQFGYFCGFLHSMQLTYHYSSKAKQFTWNDLRGINYKNYQIHWITYSPSFLWYLYFRSMLSAFCVLIQEKLHDQM